MSREADAILHYFHREKSIVVIEWILESIHLLSISSALKLINNSETI